MKNTFLTLLLMLFALPLFSQENDYFENDPQWKVTRIEHSGWDCTGTRKTFNYFINGDTVIDVYTYKKVYEQGVSWDIDANCDAVNPVAYEIPGPKFFLRSMDKKMYLYHPEHSWMGDTLLFDFNLSVDDTLQPSFANNSSYNFIVQAIDSIDTPNGYLNVFTLESNGYSYELYEGIGSSAGLIEDIVGMFLSGTEELECYSLNDQSYLPSEGGSCNVVLSVNELINDFSVHVSPNPVKDCLNIRSHKDISRGKLLLLNQNLQILDEVPLEGNELVYPLKGMSPGIYFYKIFESSTPIFTGKIIVE